MVMSESHSCYVFLFLCFSCLWLCRDEIGSTARTAALFYNDCSYLAFHAMTLGHQYCRRLPDCTKPWATMIDLVPILRDLGESRLRSYVHTQKDTLMEYMSGMYGDVQMKSHATATCARVFCCCRYHTTQSMENCRSCVLFSHVKLMRSDGGPFA